MTSRGHVVNGVIVPDEPIALVEGARVSIQFLAYRPAQASVPLKKDALPEELRHL
jgi:hypothetical protein